MTTRSMRQPIFRAASAAILAAALVAVAWAGEDEPPRRAARPKSFPPDVQSVFFDDAREQLVGNRPQRGGSATEHSAGSVAAAESDGDRFVWSQLISGETIADEIKRIANGLRTPLANPGKFRSGGYQQCRAEFSMLAVLFGVAAEFDGEVRFQESAAPLRDRFARAAANCQAATDGSYNEARERQLDLEELLRGQRPPDATDAAEAPLWSDLADAPVLMQRMDSALNEKIMPALANDRTFRKDELDVRREAQVLAMLAEVIHREDFTFYDDEDYARFATELRAAAADLEQAAGDRNYDAARAAAGRAGKACTLCHEGYRG